MQGTKKYIATLSNRLSRFIYIAAVLCFFTFAVQAVYRPLYDFTGDARTDFTVLTLQGAPGTNINWKFLRNPGIPGPGNAFIRTINHGVVGDVISAGDYFGDAKTEISVYRPGEFLYYTTPFPETSVGAVNYLNWGTTGDNAARDGDYDGDGKDDETVVRNISDQLQWWIKGSAGVDRVVNFGATATGFSTFVFQGTDFTGDGREEFVIARANLATGATTWYIGDSLTGAQVMQLDWGNFEIDFLINPDDYTGDGIADFVVWRAGGTGVDARYWFIRDSANGNLVPPTLFGIGDPNFIVNDVPLRGNYDGDDKADIAVFRPSTREWFWIRSSDGALGRQQWGEAGDTPLPRFFTF